MNIKKYNNLLYKSKLVLEGISISDDNKLIFNTIDNKTDILPLYENNHFIKDMFKKSINPVRVFIGYSLKTVNEYLAVRGIDKNIATNAQKREAKEKIDIIRREIKKLNKNLNIEKMIDITLDKFEKNEFGIKFDYIDLIITPESAAPLNNLIISKIKDKLKSNKTMILDGALAKRTLAELKLNQQEYDEATPKTKKLVDNAWHYLKHRDPNLLYAVHNVKASIRRFFINFFKFKDDETREKLEKKLAQFLAIKRGKILIVDDTIGDGNTIKDMLREIQTISDIKAKIYGLILLKDF